MRTHASSLAHQADLFAAELFDESAFDLPAGPVVGLAGAEPFFGDRRHQCWHVVARPGTEVPAGFVLQDGDLIVRRSRRLLTWQCTAAAVADPGSIYRRGSDTRLRDDVVILRRMRRGRSRPTPPVVEAESFAELIEVAGFFGPNNVRRTEQEVRDAVLARANAEWTAWHTAAGAPIREGDAAMFGRLVGYYAAGAATLMPDTLTAVQAAALAANYTALLAPAATAATIATESSRLAGVLLTGAPGAAAPGAATQVTAAIRQARQAHANAGDFAAWSAAFVTACVRGAAMSQGLEAVIGPGRQHVGRNALLLASLTHAGYTIEARRRRAATTPRERGAYHAFAPRERAPRVADIIVQDRRTGISAAHVSTLATLAAGVLTHGDIVVEVQQGFVITVGGNLGDSSRRRRYPLDQQGLLVVERRELFTQEEDTGQLPALPVRSTHALAGQSTARIFALLSPIEELAAVPGQPYGGGILT